MERTAFLVALGEVLRRARGTRRQREICEIADVSQSALSRFENGVSAPDVHELVLLARALRCTFNDLVVDAARVCREGLKIAKGKPADHEHLRAAMTCAAAGIRP